MTDAVPTPVSPRTEEPAAGSTASCSLGALLYCDGHPTSVEIRSLWPGGALLVGTGLPESGALAQLVRGSLIVHGLVSGSGEGCCELHFSGSVDVAQWRASPVNGQQQRVDDIVRLVKAGAVPLPVPALGAAPAAAERTPPADEAAKDLERVSALLVQLGDALAADEEVILAHGTALQNLDIAVQVVIALTERLRGEVGGEAALAKLAGLRRSADQALLARR